MVQHYAVPGRRPPVGARPGVLALPQDGGPRRLHVTHYGPGHIEELEDPAIETLARFREGPGVTWIEVDGLGDEAGLRRLAELFGIHPLALADVVNVPQRPKAEVYEGHDLLIAWMALLAPDGSCQLEQVSFVLGRSWLISFEERGEDVFDSVRARLRGGASIRGQGADFLAYSLLDTLIDGYYPVTESLGELLEDMEEEAVARPTPATLRRIHAARRLIQVLGRAMRQQRDALNSLVRGESPRLSEPARVYLRDAYDHTIQINELLDSQREIAVGLMELYLSSLSHRLNEVMKLLTVIATIFIPLTFLVGVYGMNFEHMPELAWPWAYPALWALMVGLALGMWIFFRRRGWLARDPGSETEDP